MNWNQVLLSLPQCYFPDSAIQVIGFVPQLHSHFFMFCLSNTHISSYCDYFVAPSVQSGNIYTSFDSKWSLKVWYVGSFHYIAGLSIWNWKLRHSVGLICRNFVTECGVVAEQGRGGHLRLEWSLCIPCWWVYFLRIAFHDSTRGFRVIVLCGVWNSGMMGSGKTTVGEVLSEALAYSFVDRLVR